MTIFVLEGVDLSGKSTLARALLLKHAPAQIIKQGPPSEADIFEQYLRPFDTLVEDPSQMLILDRWHVGELIYGPLLRGTSKLTVQQANYLEMAMQSHGCTFIHVTVDLPTLHDRYDIRGDSLIKKEWLLSIQEAYWDYASSRPHWVTQVVGGPQQYDVALFPDTPTWRFLGRYIGPAKPRVLLLGDERANKAWSWPFVPYRATSGHWLMGALAAANVNHMHVGIFNACESNPDELRRLWNLLERPPVVTLGRNAESVWKELRTAQMPLYTYLHHPAYVRRFHFNSFEAYGAQIRMAMNHG